LCFVSNYFFDNGNKFFIFGRIKVGMAKRPVSLSKYLPDASENSSPSAAENIGSDTQNAAGDPVRLFIFSGIFFKQHAGNV
jgi:hypothetical protein